MFSFHLLTALFSMNVYVRRQNVGAPRTRGIPDVVPLCCLLVVRPWIWDQINFNLSSWRYFERLLNSAEVLGIPCPPCTDTCAKGKYVPVLPSPNGLGLESTIAHMMRNKSSRLHLQREKEFGSSPVPALYTAYTEKNLKGPAAAHWAGYPFRPSILGLYRSFLSFQSPQSLALTVVEVRQRKARESRHFCSVTSSSAGCNHPRRMSYWIILALFPSRRSPTAPTAETKNEEAEREAYGCSPRIRIITPIRTYADRPMTARSEKRSRQQGPTVR